jgi:AMP-dependent synthetase/ligase
MKELNWRIGKMTLYEMLLDSATKFPDKIALIEGNNSITYSELKNKVDKLHAYLFSLGIEENTKIGLLLHNSFLFVISLYALSKNNNVVCLMDTQWAPRTIIEKCIQAKVKILFVEQYVYDRLYTAIQFKHEKYTLITRDIIEQFNLAALDIINPSAIQEHDYNVLIQSSSGTTGFSKMAYRTMRNVDIDSYNIVNDLAYDSSDVVYCPVPMCHGYGLTMGLIASVRCGATIIIARWFKANDFLNQYQDITSTIFLGIPEIYDVFIKAMKDDYFYSENHKWFFCSGAPLDLKTGHDFFRMSGIWINQVYGMMEASTISVNQVPNGDTVTSIGKLITGVEAQLVPQKNDKYALLIRGDTVSYEYVSQSGNHFIKDNEGWFNTKDLCTIDTKGNLYLHGRKDEK